MDKRNLVGYSPWVTKSQTQLNDWAHTHTTEGRSIWSDVLGFSVLPYYGFCKWVAPGGSNCCVVNQFPLTISVPQQRGKMPTWPHLQLKYNSMSTDIQHKFKKRFIGKIWKIIWKQVSYNICYNWAIVIHFQESRGFFFLSLRKGVFPIYICLRALISIGNEKHISGEKSKASVLSHHPEVSQNITSSLLLDLKCSHSENILRTSSVYICIRTLSQFSAHSSRIRNYRAEVTRFSEPPHSHLTPHHFSVRASGTKSSLNSGKEQIFVSYTWAVSTLQSRDAKKKKK